MLARLKPLQNKFIDTVLLARRKLNTRAANLDSLCKKFSIDLSARKFHGALLDCQLLSEVYLELLGGQQANLELVNLTADETGLENKKIFNKNKIYKVAISIEEIKQHKKFAAKLKDSSWSKIDY